MKAELSTPRIFWDHGIETGDRERSSSMSRDRRAMSEQKKKSVQVQTQRQRSASVGGRSYRNALNPSQYNGRDVEEMFKPMWSWYYGDQDNKVIMPSSKAKASKHFDDDDNIDLTDAMNPDWYFREHKQDANNGVTSLQSPGHIKRVGFGRNKVEFVDVLYSNGNSRRI